MSLSNWVVNPNTTKFEVLKNLSKINKDHIPLLKLPVIGIVFLSSNKFNNYYVELLLRRELKNKGYNFGQISIMPYSEIFGMDFSCCDFIFSNDSLEKFKIPFEKIMLESINFNSSNYDFILKSCEGGIIPESIINNNYYHTYSLASIASLLGMQPDSIILVIDDLVDKKIVKQNIQCIKNMFDIDVLFIVFSSEFHFQNRILDNNIMLQFVESIFNDKLILVKNEFDIPVYDITNKEDLQKIIRIF